MASRYGLDLTLMSWDFRSVDWYLPVSHFALWPVRGLEQTHRAGTNTETVAYSKCAHLTDTATCGGNVMKRHSNDIWLSWREYVDIGIVSASIVFIPVG